MSFGCEGCYISAKGQQQEFDIIKKQALHAATEQNISQAIYKEGFEFFYTAATDAFKRGLPVMEIVSVHYGVTA